MCADPESTLLLFPLQQLAASAHGSLDAQERTMNKGRFRLSLRSQSRLFQNVRAASSSKMARDDTRHGHVAPPAHLEFRLVKERSRKGESDSKKFLLLSCQCSEQALLVSLSQSLILVRGCLSGGSVLLLYGHSLSHA